MEQFTYVKRGYDPEEVDKYITTLEQVVKSYKDKDNAIKNALISAQAAADNVLRGAQSQAESYKVQISEQLVDIRATLDRQRASLQKFQEGYTNVVRMCIQELQQFNMGEMFARLDEMDEAIADLQGLEAMSGGKDNFLVHDTTKDSRGYGRETMQDLVAERSLPTMRDQEPMRERDYTRDTPVMREDRHDTMYDDDRDMLRGRDMMGAGDRDMMRQDVMHTPPEPMREPSRGRDDIPSFEPLRDRDIRGRDDMPAYDTMRDAGRDMLRDPGRDMMRDTGRDFMAEPVREPMRDMGRDMRNDAGRDIRRDMGRDMRSDTGREARRDSGRYGTMRDTPMDSMRMDNRDPMRDRAPMREPMRDRQYMPETDNYGNDDQNLLPPVASLM